MDVRRLKYTQEIFIRQRMLEDDLARLNSEKIENIKSCTHVIPVIVTKSNNPSARCLGCGYKLGSFNHQMAIDASEYKTEYYSEGLTETQKVGRVNDLREKAIKLKEENSDITDEELRTRLIEEIEKDKVKIKK